MNIKEMKEYFSKIPAELDEYPLVVREAKFLTPEEAANAAKEQGLENNGMLYAALDKPVTACFIDETTNELCMLDEPSYVVLSTVIRASQEAAAAANQPSAEVIEDEDETTSPSEESAE
jgi:hypothetical protein